MPASPCDPYFFDPHEPYDRPDPAGAARGARCADPLGYALCASYRDPARVQPVPAGTAFDLVSVQMAIGLDALDLMLRSGRPVGPVAADARVQVNRVGFLLPPATLQTEPGFAWWCRRHGLRVASDGDVVALPPLIGESTRMVWLVAPGAADTGRTDPGLLLSALRRALRYQDRHESLSSTAGPSDPIG
ncbi:hypothetical protein KDL01_36430 [Actinospica durhamensis]|uniref:Uncharacterized protein n=1 Tax=Actinospica durhamensis TaxID=1508375 RepID=A0A941IUA4_9ACTN|nr:hypothetical protein [Actinospica durhamensis]MBR7838812.1 hypothetical protein [Actinospica durhamensis]